jgi:hypothetical protein
MRVAILISGLIRNSHQTLDTFIDNIVRPNNADVFCFFSSGSEYDCLHHPTPCANFGQLLREKLGDHLKIFQCSSGDYRIRRDHMYQQCLEKTHNYISHVPQIYYFDQSKHRYRRSIVDQYFRVKCVTEILQQYEHEQGQGFAYDWIIRTRLDRMNFIGQFDLTKYIQHIERDPQVPHMERAPRDPSRKQYLFFEEGNMPWYYECFFFGTHDAMIHLCSTYVEHLGEYRYPVGKDETIDMTLTPERQLALYVANLVEHEHNWVIVRSYTPKCITHADHLKLCDHCGIYNIYM